MTRERVLGLARRVFVAAWILLGLLGALNHTIAEDLFGRRFDLLLPQLRYGYVMFNKNPRTVQIYSYADKDGRRHPLSELSTTPALGYARARLELNLISNPDVLSEVCYRARIDKPFSIFVDEFEVDRDPHHPSRSLELRCGDHGLSPH